MTPEDTARSLRWITEEVEFLIERAEHGEAAELDFAEDVRRLLFRMSLDADLLMRITTHAEDADEHESGAQEPQAD
ncbi:MAG: hypothetical protein ACQGVC_09235 [Myxococcota bacterium]